MTNLPTSIENETEPDWYEGVDGPSVYARIVFATAWILIAVAGITGNSLVVYIAIRFEKLNNVTNCFIVNLAITDIVFLAFCMPLLVVQYTLDRWYFNQTFCKLMNFISFVSVLVTVLTLVVMTMDRYKYVAKPFANLKWRKPKTVFLLSLIIWLLSCTLASPFYYHYGLTRDENTQCVLLTDETLQKHFRIYTVTLYYFIPLIIIIICYARLLHHVHHKESKVRGKTKSNAVKWSKKRRAVTRMVAIVTLVFCICWLPLTLFIMTANLFEEKTASLYYFKIIAHSFAYLNSAVNPIIYAFLNRSFRKNCGNLFSKPAGSHFHKKKHSKTVEKRVQQQIECGYSPTKCHLVRIKPMLDTDKDDVSVHSIGNDDFSDGDFVNGDIDCCSKMGQPLKNEKNSFQKRYNTLLIVITSDANKNAMTTAI